MSTTSDLNAAKFLISPVIVPSPASYHRTAQNPNWSTLGDDQWKAVATEMSRYRPIPCRPSWPCPLLLRLVLFSAKHNFLLSTWVADVFDLLWTEYVCCPILAAKCSPSSVRERAIQSSTKASSFRLERSNNYCKCNVKMRSNTACLQAYSVLRNRRNLKVVMEWYTYMYLITYGRRQREEQETASPQCPCPCPGGPKAKCWFLPARRYASAGNSDRNVSVRLSVRHAPVLCR